MKKKKEKNQLSVHNQHPKLREAIKKLLVEKIGESVLEVAGQEHAQEDSRRHWKSWISYQILADI